MEHEILLQCPQEPAAGPYPEPVEYTPHPHTLFFKLHFNVVLGFPSCPFLSGFLTKIFYGFLSLSKNANITALDFITLIIFGKEYILLKLVIM